jgi:outer membrane biosynthesis protein TonB
MNFDAGQVLAGKYRIERLLGEGGMGAVYIAENQVLQKRVALKVMNERFAAVPQAVERFLREGVAASRVSHPSIVQVFDAGEHDGKPWLAMELLRGESLGERLERGPMDLEELLRMARGTLSALAAVHAEGIVHRDLKPDNIFLAENRDGTFTPKVLDFGIAKDTSDGQLSKLTATGAVVGTAYYLSPEQAKGLPDIDARADIYAMGVVFYECLTGQMPYEAETITQLIAKMFTERPRHLSEVGPDVPVPIAQVVMTCLDPEREHRFQTMDALLAALEQAARGGSVPGTRPGDIGNLQTALPGDLGVDRVLGAVAAAKAAAAGGWSAPGASAPAVHPPSQQGYAAPSQPGYGAPGHPGYAAPGQPGFAAPGQPGYAAPGQPGYAAPSQPGFAAPSQPGYAAPSQPGFAPAPGGTPAPTGMVGTQMLPSGVSAAASAQDVGAGPVPAHAGTHRSSMGRMGVAAVVFVLAAVGTGLGLMMALDDGGEAPVAAHAVSPEGRAAPVEEEDPAPAEPEAAAETGTAPPPEAAGEQEPAPPVEVDARPPAQTTRRRPTQPRPADAPVAPDRPEPAPSELPSTTTTSRPTPSTPTPTPTPPTPSTPTPSRPPQRPRDPAPAPAGGGLSQAQVDGVMRRTMVTLQQRCFQRLARRVPGLSGTVTLQWTVQPNGAPRDVRVVYDGGSDPRLARCTLQIIQRTRFPTATAPTPVRRPFVYR